MTTLQEQISCSPRVQSAKINDQISEVVQKAFEDAVKAETRINPP